MSRCMALILTIASTISICAAQNEVKYADEQEMPASLVEDSYAIFQMVLPSNAIEWSDVKRTQWLLQDTTTAVPLKADCNGEGAMDIRRSVTPPDSRQSEWNEVLSDFDVRCHERYKLDGSRFHEAVPCIYWMMLPRSATGAASAALSRHRITSCRHRQLRTTSRERRVCTAFPVCISIVPIRSQRCISAWGADRCAATRPGLFWKSRAMEPGRDSGGFIA